MNIVQQVFEGRQFGMIAIDGVAWFEASALARHLGYRDRFNFLRNLDSFMVCRVDEKGVASSDTLGSPHILRAEAEDSAVMVSEAGLYYALTVSRRPEAEKWRKWLFGDLLPTLRRTGFYDMRDPVCTILAIGRAYLGYSARHIPDYLDHHGIEAAGWAEHPDTGKIMLLYPCAAVLEKFKIGSGPDTPLRPYSGAWTLGAPPALPRGRA